MSFIAGMISAVIPYGYLEKKKGGTRPPFLRLLP